MQCADLAPKGFQGRYLIGSISPCCCLLFPYCLLHFAPLSRVCSALGFVVGIVGGGAAPGEGDT